MAAAWLRFAPVTALTVGLAFSLSLSAALFLVGNLDNDLVLSGLIGSLIFLIFGAALAAGNRFGAMSLVMATAVGAVLSLAAEQSLKAAPYQLLMAFVLIKGTLALRASHNSSEPISRPKAAWAWMWASVIVLGTTGLAGLIRLTDHLMLASRINRELAVIERAGQPATLDELARTYPEVSPADNAATVLRPILATLLLPKSDPQRVLQVAGSNVPPTHTWSAE